MLTSDNVSQVQSLIDIGVQVNFAVLLTDGSVLTYPLHHAIGLHGSQSMFKLFQMNYFWRRIVWNLLFVLDFYGSSNYGLEILKLLMKNGADSETIDYMERTPLYKAVEYSM